MVAVSKIPSTYSFVPYINTVKQIDDFDLSREYDLVINLDVAAIDRCADAQILFNKAKILLILTITKQILVMEI